jgi:hypothetical protein
MSFTDRFIQLPIKVYDTQQAELTGKTDYYDSFMKVLPLEISNYKPMIDEDNNDVECVSVYMKNGEKFYTYLTMYQFEELLNNHQK